MRALAQMQPGTVTASAWLDKSTGKVHVTLANRASQAAFFIHARGVKPGTDEEISPVFWDDNFISLLPGESQTLSLSFPERPMRSVKIKIEGWNVAEQVLELK